MVHTCVGRKLIYQYLDKFPIALISCGDMRVEQTIMKLRRLFRLFWFVILESHWTSRNCTFDRHVPTAWYRLFYVSSSCSIKNTHWILSTSEYSFIRLWLLYSKYIHIIIRIVLCTFRYLHHYHPVSLLNRHQTLLISNSSLIAYFNVLVPNRLYTF